MIILVYCLMIALGITLEGDLQSHIVIVELGFRFLLFHSSVCLQERWRRAGVAEGETERSLGSHLYRCQCPDEMLLIITSCSEPPRSRQGRIQ